MYRIISAAVRLAVVVWLALVLAGCSVYSLPGQQEPAPPPPTTSAPPPPVPEQPAPPARDPNATNAYGEAWAAPRLLEGTLFDRGRDIPEELRSFREQLRSGGGERPLEL